MPLDLKLALATARYAVQAGGEVIRTAGLGAHAAESKGRGDYVTAVDRDSEQVIRRVLTSTFPELPVLGEEGGGQLGSHGWAVDPLDGTTNFSRGFPLVGVSVALLIDGRPEVGAVHAPFLGWTLSGRRGGGAFDQDGRRLRVSDAAFAHAVISTGFPFRAPQRLDRYVGGLHRVLRGAEDVRRPGAASLDLAYTAMGVLDGFFELGLSIWDIAAGALLVEEAGGVVTDWSGGEAHLKSGDIVAAPPAVHAGLLQALAASAHDPDHPFGA